MIKLLFHPCHNKLNYRTFNSSCFYNFKRIIKSQLNQNLYNNIILVHCSNIVKHRASNYHYHYCVYHYIISFGCDSSSSGKSVILVSLRQKLYLYLSQNSRIDVMYIMKSCSSIDTDNQILTIHE